MSTMRRLIHWGLKRTRLTSVGMSYGPTWSALKTRGHDPHDQWTILRETPASPLPEHFHWRHDDRCPRVFSGLHSVIVHGAEDFIAFAYACGNDLRLGPGFGYDDEDERPRQQRQQNRGKQDRRTNDGGCGRSPKATCER